jgi:hypothetical protein
MISIAVSDNGAPSVVTFTKKISGLAVSKDHIGAL